MKLKERAKQALQGKVRWHALQMIYAVEYKQAYANVLVDEFLAQSPLNEADNRLLVQLLYGVLQRRYTLDFYLQPFIAGRKVEPWVESLLRMSIFQKVYLDRIPDHAIVAEAVDIAKLNGHRALGNFVNGVLRNFFRTPLRSLADLTDTTERLSIQYSIQPWIVDALLAQFSQAEVERLLESLLQTPFVSARVKGTPADREQVMQDLKAEGYQVSASELSPVGIRVLSGNIVESAAFSQGQLTIQDESSQLVAPLGQLHGNERVLDACSAPGGKATHIASLLPGGELTALDISERKLQKVHDNLARMDLLDHVQLFASDASKFTPSKDGSSQAFYDRIYLDAPCSGLGLMRRKPDIKYTKTPADVTALAKVQDRLLDHMVTLLKPGGYLVYSTCTLTREENEARVAYVLEQYPEMEKFEIQADEVLKPEVLTEAGDIRVWPQQFGTDGFYIARLRKKPLEVNN